MADDELIDETISGPRLFVQKALATSGRADVFRWADEKRLSEALTDFIVRLSVQNGATIEALSGSQTVSVTDASAMVPGTRIHLNVKKAVWASVSAALPILIALVRVIFGDHSAHADLVAAVTSIVKSIPDTFHLLDENQRRIYLAVALLNRKAGGAVVADLRAIETALRQAQPAAAPFSGEALEASLDAMVQKAVLSRDGDYYATT